MANDKEVPTAPYIPWKTFKGFIQDLNGKVIPPRVDGTLLSRMSGAYQAQLRATLRFLGLVNLNGAEDEVRQELHELVGAIGTGEWASKLGSLLNQRYAAIVDGVDLQSATQGQLEEAFRSRGNVSGSALKKAVRFYLTGMNEAGIKLSPHFISVRTGTSAGAGAKNSTPRPNRPKRQKSSSSSGNQVADPAPPGTMQVPVALPSGKAVRMWLPEDLTEQEEAFVLSYLKGYFKLKHGESTK